MRHRNLSQKKRYNTFYTSTLKNFVMETLAKEVEQLSKKK